MTKPKDGIKKPKTIKLTEPQRQLAADNYLLAGKIANKVIRRYFRFVPTTELYEECFLEGCFAVCRAAAKFNPDLNIKFSTYACHAIFNAVVRFVKRESKFGFSKVGDTRYKQGMLLSVEGSEIEVANTRDCNETPNIDILGFGNLEPAIRKLPLRHQFVIRAHYADGAQSKQIEKQLGICKTTVKNIRQEAEAMLRSELVAID